MPKDSTKILCRLRALMKDTNLLNGVELKAYIIPSTDSHNSEYLAEKDKRRQFISGFSGSSGTALVTDQKALLWTDGRYFLQASQELDSNWQLMKDGLPDTPSISDWIINNLPANSTIGIDSSLYDEDSYLNLSVKLNSKNYDLIHTRKNLIDIVWNEDKTRPELDKKPFIKLNEAYTGKSTKDKLNQLREQMKNLNCEAYVITSLDEIAWLLNMRGYDIPFGTVFFSYVILTHDKCILFTDLDRLENVLRIYLLEQDNGFEFNSYDEFYTKLELFIKNSLIPNKLKIYLSTQSNHFIHSLVPTDLIHKDLSLIAKLKLIKNTSEIQSAKEIHIRDSVVLVEFLYKLDKQFKSDYSSTKIDYFNLNELNEYNLAEYLDKMRAEQENFFACSFETICAYGSNGAIIHYKPKKESSKKIEKNNFLLLDSGGHYSDMGTTDVTRTIYLGDLSTVTDYQKECFTRVLKGHIQLAMRIFPSGTRSELLDSFARQSLWEAGLDYRHGTGHGVGAMLNVHEIPIIANRKMVEIGIQENMIITNEPGYYQSDEFGIRIENCQLTIKADTKYKYATNVDFIKFEPLTYVPIQKDLILKSMLNQQELDWLNKYHEKCLCIIGDRLKLNNRISVYEWLVEQTKPL